jgi:glycosyltransferase involved in cell wall biosynthesis
VSPSTRIRIARVIARLNIGGPAIQAIELSSRLAARGFETLLIYGSLGPGEGDMRYLLDNRDEPPRAVHVPELKRAIAPYDDLRAFRQVYRLLRRFEPSLVHTHTAKAGAIGRLAAAACNRSIGRARRARIVHTYHGHVLDEYFGPAKTRMFIAAERGLAALTDRIVAISPRIQRELLHDYRIGRSEQYRTVPLGFDLDVFAAIDDDRRRQARRTLGLALGIPVVTTAGRLTAIKHHQLFLETAQRVLRVCPAATFLIAGDGELRAGLEAEAASLGIASQVRFLGWQRDLPTLYAATDIFLLTSRNEGTPVALIESLAAGCAGVSTDVGGVRDVIPTDEVGLAAPSGDAAALADLVIALIADPARRMAVGEAGRRRALERYRIQQLVADIDAMYRDLLE